MLFKVAFQVQLSKVAQAPQNYYIFIFVQKKGGWKGYCYVPVCIVGCENCITFILWSLFTIVTTYTTLVAAIT